MKDEPEENEEETKPENMDEHQALKLAELTATDKAMVSAIRWFEKEGKNVLNPEVLRSHQKEVELLMERWGTVALAVAEVEAEGRGRGGRNMTAVWVRVVSTRVLGGQCMWRCACGIVRVCWLYVGPCKWHCAPCACVGHCACGVGCWLL